MGRGSSKIDRDNTSNSRASNAKYHGFKIVTEDGEVLNLTVEGGTVSYADGSGRSTKFSGDRLEVYQSFYDSVGSEQALIDRINEVGLAKASILSDKSVEDLRKKRRKNREEHEKAMTKLSARPTRQGVNRHRAYWSAM